MTHVVPRGDDFHHSRHLRAWSASASSVRPASAQVSGTIDAHMRAGRSLLVCLDPADAHPVGKLGGARTTELSFTAVLGVHLVRGSEVAEVATDDCTVLVEPRRFARRARIGVRRRAERGCTVSVSASVSVSVSVSVSAGRRSFTFTLRSPAGCGPRAIIHAVAEQRAVTGVVLAGRASCAARPAAASGTSSPGAASRRRRSARARGRTRCPAPGRRPPSRRGSHRCPPSWSC